MMNTDHYYLNYLVNTQNKNNRRIALTLIDLHYTLKSMMTKTSSQLKIQV